MGFLAKTEPTLVLNMKDKILNILSQTDWTIIKDQDNIKMVQLQNGADKINIYWGTMTVAILNKGQEPRFLDGVTLEQLRNILGIKKQNIFQKIKSIFK